MPPTNTRHSPAGESDSGRASSWSLRQLTSFQITLAAGGLILGLAIGLFVGWIVWPVQWTNAWPADLSPEARAHYLAAVAEAYSYYGDEEAAETARNRLFDLNDNLDEQIVDAQTFFLENPQRNSRIYVGFLGQLAQRLGVESPDIIVDEGLAPEPPSLAEGQEPESAPADVPQDAQAPAWLTWTLTVLAAVILIGGGIYIIGRLARSRPAARRTDTYDDDGAFVDEFDDEPDYTQHGQPPATSRVPRDSASTSTQRASGPGQPAPAFDTPQADDYGFDDEGEESYVVYSPGAEIDALDEWEDEDGDDMFDEQEPPATNAALTHASLARQTHGSTSVQQEPSPTTDEIAEGEDSLESPSTVPADGEASAKGSQAAAASRATAQKGTVLGQFTARYEAGVLDYSQSFNVLDAEGSRYVGECGMGVNMKNGVLQSNQLNVIALDVWLFDKKNERNLSNVSRVLLSEYVIDSNLEQAFTKERPNDPSPLVAQPGVTFQLKGQGLVLDCEITEARYVRDNTASGIFQSVTVEMTVRSKD